MSSHPAPDTPDERSDLTTGAIGDEVGLVDEHGFGSPDFARVLAQAPVGIIVLRGPEHIITLTNTSYDSLVGGRPLRGIPVREAFPDVEARGVFDLMDRVYRSGKPYREREMRVVYDRDGTGHSSEAFFDVAWVPYNDASGAVEGIIAVTMEVTELVHERHRS